MSAKERLTVRAESARYAEALRSNPGTASSDGHTGWECNAGASLNVEAMTPGPGQLGTLHAVIYACPEHQAAAEERIQAAGYEPQVEPARPGHQWDPWPCGHITAVKPQALATLGEQSAPLTVRRHPVSAGVAPDPPPAAALADTWDREAESLGINAGLMEAAHLPVALTMRGRARQLAECAAQLRAAIARPDVCGCGHPAVSHAIRADKTRGACSASEGERMPARPPLSPETARWDEDGASEPAPQQRPEELPSAVPPATPVAGPAEREAALETRPQEVPPPPGGPFPAAEPVVDRAGTPGPQGPQNGVNAPEKDGDQR